MAASLVPRNVSHFDCGQYLVPLITTGPLTGTAREVYAILGIDTVDLQREDGTFHLALTQHIKNAREVIEANAEAGEGKISRTVPKKHLLIPYHQPAISPVQRETYTALGIKTVNIRMSCVTHTVLADLVPTAKAQLTAQPPITHHYGFDVTGVTFDEFYVGTPPAAVRVLAAIFGVRFLRVVGDGGAICCIPMRDTVHLATLERVGALAPAKGDGLA